MPTKLILSQRPSGFTFLSPVITGMHYHTLCVLSVVPRSLCGSAYVHIVGKQNEKEHRLKLKAIMSCDLVESRLETFFIFKSGEQCMISLTETLGLLYSNTRLEIMYITEGKKKTGVLRH